MFESSAKLKKTVLFLFVISISLTLVCTPRIVVKGQEDGAYRLGVYAESSCTYPFRFDYWALNRGDTKNVTAYLRNDGTENVTEITTTTWYWSPPSAAEYVGLTLDCSNQFLQPSNVTDATFTIHAYENASLGSFNFLLNISAHYGAVIFTKLFILDGYIAEPHPKFSVFSDHGSPIPSVGDHAYNSWDSIVCSVAPVVEENGLYWACIGYNGTGTIEGTSSAWWAYFPILQNSSITFNWQQILSFNTTLTFSRASYSFMAGEAFNVTIVVQNVKRMQSWQLGLSYDPNILEYQNVSIPPDNIFQGHNVQLLGPDTSVPGYIVLGLGPKPEDLFSVDGSGKLCTLTFIGKNLGNSSLTLSNFGADTFLLNASSYDIRFMVGNSNASSVNFHGDVNKDGVVNVRDVSEAVLAFNSFPSTNRWNANADLDNNDHVDMRDIVIVVLNFNKHE